jgi:hypothetical protein
LTDEFQHLAKSETYARHVQDACLHRLPTQGASRDSIPYLAYLGFATETMRLAQDFFPDRFRSGAVERGETDITQKSKKNSEIVTLFFPDSPSPADHFGALDDFSQVSQKART